MMRLGIFLFFILFSTGIFAQNYEEYSIEQFYRKVDLEYGTLDEDGDDIDFVFVETELDEGRYDIEISDGPGDLYEIVGTEYYIKFSSYYGYAGYGDPGILVVKSSSYYSSFLKEE